MTAQAEYEEGAVDERVVRRLAECRPLVQAVCEALAEEIDKLAFPAGAIQPEPPEENGYLFGATRPRERTAWSACGAMPAGASAAPC